MGRDRRVEVPPKTYPSRRITLIKQKIEINPHLHNLYQFAEMYRQQMRLRAIALPEVIR